MSRHHILHCHRCQSRTEFFTDGRGQLVERLNHTCECPPVQYQPDRAAGGQPLDRWLARQHGEPRRCVDCQTQIEARGKRRRCPPCSLVDQRRRSRERMRNRRRQEALSA